MYVIDSTMQFSKHATCTSTFDVACYGPEYKKNQDVVDFFDAVVRAFKMFPTFDMLAASGILPSNKTTYSLGHIQTALKAQTGAIPYLGCGSNGTVLQEVWYFNHVIGTVSALSTASAAEEIADRMHRSNSVTSRPLTRPPSRPARPPPVSTTTSALPPPSGRLGSGLESILYVGVH